MSSTNRGYDRHKSDYYVTPKNPVRKFLNEFLEHEDIKQSKQMQWFDPCAGGSLIDDATYPFVIKELIQPIKPVFSTDIRDDSKADAKGVDYRYYELDYQPDIIITNPPFNIAIEIIEKALADVAHGGYVIMLLRLNFYGSVTREPFFEENMPISCYIHSRRMSFTPDNKTDSIEYAHFVWRKGENPSYTRTYHLRGKD